MSKATAEQTRKANRAAAAAAVFVGLFALAFVGLITMLDAIADERDQSNMATVAIVDEPAPINPFYVLLIGSDTRKGTALYTGKPTEHGQVDQRSDVMTLMRVDPQTYRISLLSIPRDTVLSDDGEKINSALLGDDPSQVVEAAFELTGLRADYYMLTTFGAFADLIDALGGVYVDVPIDVKTSDPMTGGNITVKAGTHKLLDGAQALALARARAEYVYDQDALRQVNVRALEQAIIERVLEDPDVNIEALLLALAGDVETDMDLSVVGPAVLDFIQNAESVKIYAGTGPYSGGPRASDQLWVIANDCDTWAKVMDEFKHGRDFTHVVEPPEMPDPPQEETSGPAPSAGEGAKSGASASASGSGASAASASGAASSSSAAPSSGASSTASASSGASSSASAEDASENPASQGASGTE